jgi:predicted nucleic acid-binding protein
VIYDTNFLVALQGRHSRVSAKKALAWVIAHDTGILYLPRLAQIEFIAGFPNSAEATPYLKGFVIVPIDEVILHETTALMRELRGTGKGIGVADSMLAATARIYGLPLVTENVKHFSRVKGIKVINYAISS